MAAPEAGLQTDLSKTLKPGKREPGQLSHCCPHVYDVSQVRSAIAVPMCMM